jgi:hypothetical protein
MSDFMMLPAEEIFIVAKSVEVTLPGSAYLYGAPIVENYFSDSHTGLTGVKNTFVVESAIENI